MVGLIFFAIFAFSHRPLRLVTLLLTNGFVFLGRYHCDGRVHQLLLWTSLFLVVWAPCALAHVTTAYLLASALTGCLFMAVLLRNAFQLGE